MTEKGFFASLFDMSFSSLVTTKVIKVIYVISLLGLTLAALLLVVAGFRISTAAGVVCLLIIAPLYWLFGLVYARVGLEFIIALFRVMETNIELVALKRQEMGLSDGGPRPVVGATTPIYHVGDVVNGHRFNGTEWVPVDPA